MGIFWGPNSFFGSLFWGERFDSEPEPEPEYDPSTIANLALWLRADQGITLDTSAGTDTVSAWEDQGSLGATFVQGTKANQPLFVPNELNGQPILRYDGTNDTLRITSGAGLDLARNQGALTLFVVWKGTTGLGTKNVFSVSNGLSAASTRLTLRREGSVHRLVVRRLDAVAATTLDGSSLSTTDAIVSTAIMDWTNGDGFLYLNGVLDASNTTLTTSGSTSDTDSIAIAVGSMSDGNSVLTGDIAEILAYQRKLTTDEQQEIEAYLMDRYGV